MSPILGIFASAVVPPVYSYESIATVAGTGSSNTITFSNIPSGFQHLQIRFIGKSTTTAPTASSYDLTIKFNSSASSYASHRLFADGATVTASGNSGASSITTSDGVILNSSTSQSTANMHSVGIIDIHDYRSTSKNKTLRMIVGTDNNRSSSPTGRLSLTSGLWYATPAAITSIDFIVGTGNWTTTSSFALYGIRGTL